MQYSIPALLLAASLTAAAQSAASIDVRTAPYSAVGDAIADDTAAFQKALDAAHAAGGGVVFAPTGKYLIAGRLRVPPGVTLQGIARAPQAWAGSPPCTTLLVVADAGKTDGEPFLTLSGPNATLEGVAIFYPKQEIRETPIPYPWTIRGIGENVALINVLLVNPYQAVDLGTHPAGRHYVRGLYGQPLFKGIYVDQCYDIGRIKDVHFWPFWSLDQKIINYTTTHGTTFIFQRTDWEIVDDVFCWGYRTGVELSASKHGGMNGQMANINLDNVDIGFDVSETQPYAIHVSNLNIANAGAGAQHIGILGRSGTNTAELSVRGASFWGTLNRAVQWENSGTFSLSDSRIQQWSRGQTAVEILKGRALVHDNSWMLWKNRTNAALRIGPGVDRVTVHDNHFNNNTVTNEGGSHAVLTNNQP